jgi:hypothetical protein
MKHSLCLFALCLSAVMLFAQVPRGWETNPPRDTAEMMYGVGVSTPQETEQGALANAWQNVLQNFAASIGTRVSARTDSTVTEQSWDSEIADAFTVTVESSSFSTQVRLTGVREIDRKIERQGAFYIAYILAVMNTEDWQRALRYIENEEASFLAYRFFAQRVSAITPLNALGKPAGFEDFYGWLRNFCISAVVDAGNGASYPDASYMDGMARFVKKLYRNSLSFSANIEGYPACVVYDSPRYFDGFFRALAASELFTLTQANGVLFLAPKTASSLNAFTAYVDAMKDSSKIFVTGVEVIATAEGRALNPGNLVVNQFKALAAREFGMAAVNFDLPARYAQDGVPDEGGIVSYIGANLSAFPARYAAVCHTETSLEPGLPAYRIPPVIMAQTSFTVYDVLTGEQFQSAAVDTRGFAFSPSGRSEQAVLAESRRAIQFLYDPRNPDGLAAEMRRVLGGL